MIRRRHISGVAGLATGDMAAGTPAGVVAGDFAAGAEETPAGAGGHAVAGTWGHTAITPEECRH